MTPSGRDTVSGAGAPGPDEGLRFPRFTSASDTGEPIVRARASTNRPAHDTAVPGERRHVDQAVNLEHSAFSAESRPSLNIILKGTLKERCPITASLLLPDEAVGEMFQRVTGTPLVITIDGLSAYGKGVAAKFLANYYGVREMSSGLAYRAAAYLCKHELREIRHRSWSKRRDQEKNHAVLTDDETRRVLETVGTAIDDERLRVVDSNNGTRIELKCGRRFVDITDKLLSHEFAQGASILGDIEGVRLALRPFLRSFGSSGWITDGRDMGTEVYPDAPVKFFFGDADDDERLGHAYVRALWRMKQWEPLEELRKAEGILPITEWIRDPEELAQFSESDRRILEFVNLLSWSVDGLLLRDEHDMNRKVAPLRCPEDAIRFSPIVARAHPPVGDRFHIPAEDRVDENGAVIPEEKLNGLHIRAEWEVKEEIAKLADQRIEEILAAFLGGNVNPKAPSGAGTLDRDERGLVRDPSQDSTAQPPSGQIPKGADEADFRRQALG